MYEIESAFWFCGVCAKASALLAIVWLGSWFIRKRSAATQHRWWVLGFAGCLLVPAVSCVTPAWTLPPTPEWMQLNRFQSADESFVAAPRSVGMVAGESQSKSIAQSAEMMTPQPPSNNEAGSIQQKSDQLANPIAVVAPKQVDTRPVSVFAWSKVLTTIWIFGVAIVYLRCLWQHCLLHRMLRRCSKLEGADWQSLLSESSELLGVGANVELLQHDAAHSPITAGAWRPVVILPSDARSWSRDRQRLVLLHELAHVSRRDVLTQTLAGLVCGLHWFNPLFWFGLLQMRKLRELACDDLVLSCGQQPAGYADVLLDIAKSYRHQTYASAVGMARNSNVETRIMAILDKTRHHVKLSPTAARMLFVFAAALLCVVATAQLRTQAEPPAPAAQEEQPIAKVADESDDEDDGEDMRTLKIRILDEEGNPLPDATMTAGAIYARGYKGYRIAREHSADDNGTILLRLPKRVISMQLWTWQTSCVGEFKGYPEGTHDEGKLIPKEFEFRLAKGHPIGGRIVDVEGNPIEGVKVEGQCHGGPPMSNMWMGHSKTDAAGHWQLRSAPARPDEGADCKFVLNVSHEDYISDENWGDAQKAQGIEPADLRRGDAKIVLKRGTSISGAVVDVEGDPITKGWVVWSDEPYFSQGVWEAALDSDGRYRTPPLPDAEYPITIVAPGFAAQRRVVKVGSDSRDQPFKLRPGKRITLRFVDSTGAPVPQVGVFMANSSSRDTWQRSNALHNHKHSGVPEYGIPRWADDQGVFVWDWAPEEPVKYGVGARGFAPQKVTLVPKAEPHVITLASARVVTGKVTDKTTGKPIEKFQAMPVIVFRADNLHTRYEDLKQGAAGRYEVPLTGGNPSVHYRVRIEADGYRSVVSAKSFGPQDGRVALDMQLEPAPMRKGRVINPDGSPVANAKLIQGTPTWVPNMRNGEPDSYGERIIESDSDGLFAVNATTEPVRIRAIHDFGFVEKLVQPEEESIGDLQLQPWAKVTGRLMQDGQPVGNQTVYFNTFVRRGLVEPRFQDSNYASTSPDGTFAFDRLPPGLGAVRPDLGPWRDSPLTSGESLPLELKPGTSHEIVLGGEGAVVTGQVMATGRDEVPLDRKYSINYLVSRDRGVTPSIADGFPKLSFDPSTPMQLSWRLDSHFNDWLATREKHFAKLTADGNLRVTGVAPGDYDLVIRLYEQPAGCLVETVGEKIVPVQVKGNDKVELGRIEVPCRLGPRPGSNMRAFGFVDSTGVKKLVNDMSGSYVLMHVWASWCQPCMDHMPEIQQTADSMASKPITFVGLNVDQDSTVASELVKKGGWNWSQNYLGHDSDMARQLAISSVPTYYLVGPDGKLVTSSNQWKDVKKKLVASLEEATNE